MCHPVLVEIVFTRLYLERITSCRGYEKKPDGPYTPSRKQTVEPFINKLFPRQNDYGQLSSNISKKPTRMSTKRERVLQNRLTLSNH